LAESK